MEIGIDSFAAAYDAAGLAESPALRMNELVEQVVTADEVGLDSFGVGEHHRKEYLDSAAPVILAAAAARTKRIRLTSAVTVLSAIDPVRLYQQFAKVAGAVLVRRDGLVVEPLVGAFGAALRTSRAWQYASDPAKYFAAYSEPDDEDQ